MKVAKLPRNQSNCVVYIHSAELFKKLATDLRNVTFLSTEVLNRFVGRMYTYETSKVFLDVGTSETYEQANN